MKHILHSETKNKSLVYAWDFAKYLYIVTKKKTITGKEERELQANIKSLVTFIN